MGPLPDGFLQTQTEASPKLVELRKGGRARAFWSSPVSALFGASPKPSLADHFWAVLVLSWAAWCLFIQFWSCAALPCCLETDIIWKMESPNQQSFPSCLGVQTILDCLAISGLFQSSPRLVLGIFWAPRPFLACWGFLPDGWASKLFLQMFVSAFLGGWAARVWS